MRRRMFIILGLVLIVIIFGILLFRGIGSGSNRAALTPTPITTKTIIFAAQDIPLGTVITDEYLEEGEWPQNVVYDYVLTDKSAVLGKRARVDIKRGEPVLSTSILSEGDQITEPGSLTASKISPGNVAIAIPMSRLSGVANAIRNGDHIMVIASLLIVDLDQNNQSVLPDSRLILFVDKDGKVTETTVVSGQKFTESPLTDNTAGVLGAYYVPQESQRPRLVSAVVVSNSKVLNVGTVVSDTTALPSSPIPASTTPQPTGGSSNSKTLIPSPTSPDVLVVEVTPEEAISLDFIIRLHGDLTYALRGIGDSTPISLPSWDLQRLMDNRKIDMPAKLNYGTSPRTVQGSPNPPFADVLYTPVLGNDVVVQAK